LVNGRASEQFHRCAAPDRRRARGQVSRPHRPTQRVPPIALDLRPRDGSILIRRGIDGRIKQPWLTRIDVGRVVTLAVN
jgi:hypothetical protein